MQVGAVWVASIVFSIHISNAGKTRGHVNFTPKRQYGVALSLGKEHVQGEYKLLRFSPSKAFPQIASSLSALVAA